MKKILYSLSHAPINAHFSKNASDFVVREVPLYEFSGDGEHAVVLIEKKDLTTHEALQILSEHLGVKMRDFGYAGLKDRAGYTTQYVSFPFKFAVGIEKFSHEKLKISNITKHNNKLRIGHLKGNNFFIRLKKVTPTDATKLAQAIANISKNGFANYFGYQRFGKFGDNAEIGFEILCGKKYIKNPKMREFLISACQSSYFNDYVAKRIEISKFAKEFSLSEFCKIYKFSKEEAKLITSQPQFYKLLPGEILGHFPHGKFFVCENLQSELKRFLARDITSCGLIAGNRGMSAEGLALRFESEIYEPLNEYTTKMIGGRRFVWSYIEDAKYTYNEELAQFNISFYLPKGSYATVVLEEILHRDIFENIEFGE